jgi:hypothetical protein
MISETVNVAFKITVKLRQISTAPIYIHICYGPGFIFRQVEYSAFQMAGIK